MSTILKISWLIPSCLMFVHCVSDVYIVGSGMLIRRLVDEDVVRDIFLESS